MMRRTLFTTVAAGALSFGLSAALAQTNSLTGGSETAPGRLKPPVTTSEPGRSEAAPGRNRPEISTTAPGQSERAPGQTRDTGSTGATSRSTVGGDELKPQGQGQRQGAEMPRDSRPSTASDAKSDSERVQRRTGENRGVVEETAPSTTRRSSQSPSRSTSDDQQDNSRSVTESRDGRERSTAGSRNETVGATGSVSGAVDLDPQQRTRVTQAFTARDVEPVTNVNFSISTGSTVTDSVRLYEVPSDVVEIVPQYRGYRYFVVRDEIVIVEPRTRKIVEVIHKSGRRSASAGASLKLSTEQRRALRSSVETTGSVRTTTRTTIDLREGVTLPEEVELYDVPTTIISETPELRTYRYVVIGDEIGLVDPDTRRVVTIIEE